MSNDTFPQRQLRLGAAATVVHGPAARAEALL